jgi:linoleoyl-CoA desaturase
MQIQFVDKEKSTFFFTLRQRVDTYFKENNISKFCNRAMILKTVILLSAYLLPFLLMLILELTTGVMIAMWCLMGLSLAGIGMSVMHDANHGAYSSRRRINYWLGHTLNLLGGSVFNWKMQHNLLHHTCTNIVHHDDDIDDKLIMRFSPHTTVKWYHRFQFVYAFAFYGILTLYWALGKDFVQFFKYKKEGVNKADAKQSRIILSKIIFSKLIYFFVFLVLPIILLKKDPGLFIGGFLLMHFIAGIILTVIFQLAHTVEGTSYPLPDESGTIENCWAMHQLSTTVNFSRHNKWLSWYVGGLNFQVEHHLFPTICHVHYPDLAPIVKTTAEEFGIPYLENETFLIALRSHFSTLKNLGKLPPLNEAIS